MDDEPIKDAFAELQRLERKIAGHDSNMKSFVTREKVFNRFLDIHPSGYNVLKDILSAQPNLNVDDKLLTLEEKESKIKAESANLAKKKKKRRKVFRGKRRRRSGSSFLSISDSGSKGKRKQLIMRCHLCEKPDHIILYYSDLKRTKKLITFNRPRKLKSKLKYSESR